MQVASLEERLMGRSEVEREKDDEFVKNRKLLKLVDKYKAELNERLMEIQDLKARLLESSDIRVSACCLKACLLESSDIRVSACCLKARLLESSDIRVSASCLKARLLESSDIRVSVRCLKARLLESSDIRVSARCTATSTYMYVCIHVRYDTYGLIIF